jgi:PAS domain S-box-containing protein
LSQEQYFIFTESDISRLKNAENKMNVFAWVTIIASFICMSFGITVYSFNRRALINKVFAVMTLFAFIYAFTEAMMWQSSSYVSAFLWSKMGAIWPFFAALVLHFALVFTGSKWLRNKVTYVFLYLPAVLFFIIGLFTDLINSSPIMEYWGYDDLLAHTLVTYISTLWVITLPVLSTILCYRYYRAAPEEDQRQERKFVAVGLAIPVFTYIVTNALFPIAGIYTPNLGHIAILFFAAFSGYAILKYDLFIFDAALAAENIISIMPDSLILADIKGKILSANKQLVDFLGYSKAELERQFISKFCLDDRQCLSLLEELSEKRAINDYELTFKTKYGEKKNVLFSGAVVRSKTGRDIGLACIIHDITRHKEMEQKLVRTERLALIGEIAGMVGHDIRNPLQGITSAVYLIKTNSDSRLTDEDREMLEIIEEAIERSNKIVNDLLDYSREIKLDLRETTPKALIDNLLSNLEIPRGIKFKDGTEKEPKIFVDAEKINRVFVNLAKNAFEAMPNGGTLHIKSAISNGNVIFSFSDTGIGISQDSISRLWTPLFTTKAKGMGFGLAICRRFVEAHKGRISVESILGIGTTFTLTIPLNLPEDSNTALNAR